MRWSKGGIVFVTGVFACAAWGQAPYHVTLAGNGWAYSISNNGVTVGQYLVKVGDRTYRYGWVNPGFGAISSTIVTPRSVHDAADGSYWVAGDSVSRWNSSTGTEDLLPYSSSYGANDVNAKGEVVGTGYSSGSYSAWVYADWGDGLKMHELPRWNLASGGTNNGGARAISDNGYVTGSLLGTDNFMHAFLYKDGVMKDLGRGVGMDVNDLGQVLISNDGLPSQGWIYDDRTGVKKSMGYYGAIAPQAINRWGQVVGSQIDFSATPVMRGFLWENGEFYDLYEAGDNPSLTLNTPTGINDRGQIVGSNGDQFSMQSAWVMTPNAGTTGLYPQAASILDKKSASGQFERAPTEKWYALWMSQSGSAAASEPVGFAPEEDRDLGAAQAYQYRAKAGSRFSGILQFPQGFDQPFTLRVGDVVLGSFSPGQQVSFATFAALLGSAYADGGVGEFTVTGISAQPELRSFVTFSLKLEFAAATADFTMQARNNLIGDADGDGHVGFGDFTVLRGVYGQNGLSWYDGDFNLDGTIGADDFALMSARFDQPMTPAQTAEIAAFAASVPEPTSLITLLASSAILGLRRRRRA